jgi:hypothetical protein
MQLKRCTWIGLDGLPHSMLVQVQMMYTPMYGPVSTELANHSMLFK